MNIKLSLTILFIPAALISCQSSVGNDETVTSSSLVMDEMVTNVETVTVTSRRFNHTVIANGKISSAREQLIESDTEGRLSASNARPGTVFQASDVIAVLETTAIKHRLQRAELKQFNSQKEYESQLISYENLLKDKNATQADLIKRKLKISSGLLDAELDIAEANYDLEKALIRAPFRGVIANVEVAAGQRIKMNQPLFTIYDPENLFLDIQVLESEIALLRAGSKASVESVTESGVVYGATVSEINPYVDESGMIKVKLKINGRESSRKAPAKLYPGMNCIAKLAIEGRLSILVPKQAIVSRNGKPVVFTIEDNRAKWNFVSLGNETDNEVEILSGLKTNDRVIVTNNLQLAHDAPIKYATDTK